MTSDSFFIGLLIGVGAVVVVGFIWFLLSWLLKLRTAFFQPQKVIHFTPQTPAEIAQKAGFANGGLLLVKVLLIFGGWLLLKIYSPEIADLIAELTGEILIALLKALIRILEIVLRQLSGA